MFALIEIKSEDCRGGILMKIPDEKVQKRFRVYPHIGRVKILFNLLRQKII